MAKRVASAIVIALIFIPFLLMGGIYFTVFMSIIGMLGLYELLHIRADEKKDSIRNENYCLYNGYSTYNK